MNRLKYGALLCVLTVFGVAGCSPAAAATAPIVVEPLSPRAAFTDDVQMQLRIKLDGEQTQVINLSDPSRVVTARITMQPGATFPWHTHAGPVIITVTQGEFTYVRADDCVQRIYPAGTVVVDPGQGTVHTAFNSAGPDVVTVLHATFFDAPDAPGSLTIPADPPADCDAAAGTHAAH